MATVKTLHPCYENMAPSWKRCRDMIGGTRTIHAAGTEYLPKLTDEDQEAYEARLNRTIPYNATSRTIVGFLGLLQRKPAVINVPESVRPMMEDITLTGIPLRIFAGEVAEECLATGRVGIWVNYPTADTARMTLADAQRQNLRPSMQMFEAESILNWKTTRINNKTTLSLVVLAERAVVEEPDEFTEKTEVRYRVLSLDAETAAYSVRIFRVNDKDENELIDGPYYPLMDGKPLDYIPFYFVSADDISTEVDDPPLIDLVDVNLAHYQVTADYENGCHWSGIPTMLITGYTIPDGTTIKVGAGKALVLPPPEAKAEMIEIGTQGFAALEKNLDRKESQMVVLGARILEVQKPGIEAAETALIHRAGEQSILSNMAQTIGTGITQALITFVRWAGAEGEASFELTREFFNTALAPQMFTALVAGWQQGAISHRTLFEQMKKGEIYDPDATYEEELAQIQPVAPQNNM